MEATAEVQADAVPLALLRAVQVPAVLALPRAVQVLGALIPAVLVLLHDVTLGWGRSNSRSGSSNYYNRYYNNYDSDHSYDDPNNDTYEDPSYDDSTSDNSYSSQSYDNSGYSQEQQDMDSRFIPLAVIIVFVATGMFLIMIAGNSKDSARKPQPRFNASPMNWLSGSDGVSNYYDISDDDTSYDSDSGDYDYNDDNSYDSGSDSSCDNDNSFFDW